MTDRPAVPLNTASHIRRSDKTFLESAVWRMGGFFLSGGYEKLLCFLWHFITRTDVSPLSREILKTLRSTDKCFSLWLAARGAQKQTLKVAKKQALRHYWMRLEAV